MKKKIQNRGFDIDNPLDTEWSVARTREEEINKFKTKNTFLIFLLFSFALGVLLLRSFYLQAIRGTYFQDVSENNRIREVVIRAPRGNIKDAFGLVLAQNIPSFDVVFVPAHLPKKAIEKTKMIKRLSFLISKDNREIIAQIEEKDKDDRKTYLLEENIVSDVALELIERNGELPGVYVGKSARRKYEDGEIFSHIIGYDGKITKKELEENSSYIMADHIGKSGLEYSFEEYLHGIHGVRRFEINSNNDIKEDLGIVNPVQGDTLVLHVDGELQKQIHGVIENILKENQDATGAAVVAVDPRNGGVRAIVSFPEYNNNLFSGGITKGDYEKLIDDKRKPLLNKVIAGEYPPGSTFKPMIAAMALQEGTITEHTSIDCRGAIHVGNWVFPDWKTHGYTDVRKAIAESCDVFFYAVGGGWGGISGLGADKMNQYGKIFGFGSVTGIDLPGETNGNLPDSNWKFKKFGEKWYIGDSYHVAIGQGYVTVTPIQLVMAIATVANGGTLYRPHLVSTIEDSQTGEIREIEPKKIVSGVINKESLEIVREGMHQTVTGSGGSGRSLSSLEVSSAGKTGTSQFGNEGKTHSWYVSFAPYENPEIAMVVLIEGGGEGHSWAVPATKKIYQWLFDQRRGARVSEETE